MEDWNTLAADCAVISCCCQCLIIQILVFILLKLPYKVVRKAKEYAKKKLGHRRTEKKITETEKSKYKEEIAGLHERSLRTQVEEFPRDGCHGCGCCMEEVEKVLEDLSQKGEFAFGSFWGRRESESLPTFIAKQEFDYNVLQYHLTEMIGPISCP